MGYQHSYTSAYVVAKAAERLRSVGCRLQGLEVRRPSQPLSPPGTEDRQTHEPGCMFPTERDSLRKYIVAVAWHLRIGRGCSDSTTDAILRRRLGGCRYELIPALVYEQSRSHEARGGDWFGSVPKREPETSHVSTNTRTQDGEGDKTWLQLIEKK